MENVLKKLYVSIEYHIDFLDFLTDKNNKKIDEITEQILLIKECKSVIVSHMCYATFETYYENSSKLDREIQQSKKKILEILRKYR